MLHTEEQKKDKKLISQLPRILNRYMVDFNGKLQYCLVALERLSYLIVCREVIKGMCVLGQYMLYHKIGGSKQLKYIVSKFTGSLSFLTWLLDKKNPGGIPLLYS